MKTPSFITFDPIDAEEQELRDLMDAGRLHRDDQSDIRLERMRSSLDRIRAQKIPKTIISLRSNTTSLETIKQFAREQGIPYQTLINNSLDQMADTIRHESPSR